MSQDKEKKPPQRPKLTYQECDDLVKAYRDHGDKEAAQNLINAFEGYTVKFYNIVRRGKGNIHDINLREFAKLYIKNEYSRRHIHQYKRMPSVQQDFYNICESIRELCAPYSDEELKNEITVALLTMAKRYHSKDDLPRFHSYILRAFHFQLRRQLQTLVSDPIVFRISKNINFHDDYGDGDENNDAGDMEDNSMQFTIDNSLDSVNDNWVLGYTTNEEYRHFTIMERKIIKLYYVDKLSDQSIADMLGTCRATVNRRRNRIVKILEEHYRKLRRIN